MCHSFGISCLGSSVLFGQGITGTRKKDEVEEKASGKRKTRFVLPSNEAKTNEGEQNER